MSNEILFAVVETMVFQAAWFAMSVGIVVLFFGIDFKVPLDVVPLGEQTDLYSDRPYRMQGPHRLIGQVSVVPIERHHRTRIVLRLASPGVVYRLLSDVNVNDPFSDWPDDEEPILAPGSDYEGNENHLTRAVAREFAAGTWTLPPGGPRFASPILVQSDGTVTAYTVCFFNKIVGPIRQNKKKLVGALAFIAATNAVVWLFR